MTSKDKRLTEISMHFTNTEETYLANIILREF